MVEIWKDIKGYEGYYEISNFGNVRSVKRTIYNKGNKRHATLKSNILKQTPDLRGGYMQVSLSKEHKIKTVKVHRLVACHFCEGYKDGLIINHKDGNRKNNIYSNLEWCSQKENIRHAAEVLHKTWGGPTGAENPKSKKIAQYTLDNVLIKEFDSIRGMERETGFNSSCICKVLKGKSMQAYGFYWKYL